MRMRGHRSGYFNRPIRASECPLQLGEIEDGRIHGGDSNKAKHERETRGEHRCRSAQSAGILRGRTVFVVAGVVRRRHEGGRQPSRSPSSVLMYLASWLPGFRRA